MQLNEHIPAPSGWTARTIDAPENWVHALPNGLVDAYAEGGGKELNADPALLDDWRPVFEPMIRELDEGRGFILIDRVPVESARRVYWRIGQSLGTPIEQNVEGTLLYDVKGQMWRKAHGFL